MVQTDESILDEIPCFKALVGLDRTLAAAGSDICPGPHPERQAGQTDQAVVIGPFEVADGLEVRVAGQQFFKYHPDFKRSHYIMYVGSTRSSRALCLTHTEIHIDVAAPIRRR